jgi:threonine dehydratase
MDVNPTGAPLMPLDTSITPDRIAETERLIRPHVRHTPILHVDLADFGAEPGPLALKLECLQHSGSFKARGAFANLPTQSIPTCGVVAASGGNHGAAVAYAAMRLGVPATIFLPSVTSPSKAERVRSYAANLVVAGQRYADALAPKRVGNIMFPIAQAFVDRVVLISDDDIRAAQLALWDKVRVVAEPGGAAAFAALLSGKYSPAPDERVAVMVSGANTTAVKFD